MNEQEKAAIYLGYELMYSQYQKAKRMRTNPNKGFMIINLKKRLKDYEKVMTNILKLNVIVGEL
jgi:hypothetical protein